MNTPKPKLFISEKTGSTPSELGKRIKENGTYPDSYPVVLATDRIFAIEKSTEPLPPEILAISMFGFSSQDERILLFADTNTYGIDETKWSIDTSLTNEQFLPTGGIWSRSPLGIGLTASYGGIDAFPTYSNSAINLVIPSGFNSQQKFISCVSKQLFTCDVGANLFISFGIQFTKTSGIKKAGLFSAQSGWYIKVQGSGAGDNFSIVQRYLDEDGNITEREYKRSHPVFFDRLDGSGSSRLNLNLDLVVMIGIELGSYDGSAVKFYVYAADALQNGSHRWIMFANIPTSDDSFIPERISSSLPITFENFSNSLNNTEIVSKYGTSAIKIGVDTSPLRIFSQSSPTVVLPPEKEQLVMGILTRGTTQGKPCRLQQYIKYINLNSNVPAELIIRRFSVTPNNSKVLNLEISATVTLSGSGLDAINTSNLERLGAEMLSIVFSGGKQVNLTKVFQEYREFFSSSFNSFGANISEPVSQDLILFYMKNLGELLSNLEEQISWVNGINNNPTDLITTTFDNSIGQPRGAYNPAIGSISVITTEY